MNPTPNDPERAHRIAVILRGGEADTGALGILASVISEFSAEVAGLFLEDVDLFRLAELPFSHQISRLTSRAQPLSTIELEREVRVQAVRAERALRLTAEKAGLKWSFRRMRGRLEMAIQAAPDVSLLLLTGTRHGVGSAGETSALGRALRAGEDERARTVVVVYDGSNVAILALQAARRISTRANRSLEVLLVAATPEDEAELRAQAAELIRPQVAHFRRISVLETETLRNVMRGRAPTLLVLGVETGLPERFEGGLLRESIGCPVLIVR